MSKFRGNRICRVAAIAALAVALPVALPSIRAEEEDPAKERSAAEAAAEKPAKSKARKAKGRLPAFYGRVVTEEQRGEIYAIQTKYRPRIEDLTAELKRLRDKRREEVEAVLTSDQREQISMFRSKAKEGRRQMAAARKKQTAAN